MSPALSVLQPRGYVDIGAQVSGQILRLQPGDVGAKEQLLVEIHRRVQRATVDAGRASLAGLRAQLADQRAQHGLAEQRQTASDGATRDDDVQGAEAALASAAAGALHREARQACASILADIDAQPSAHVVELLQTRRAAELSALRYRAGAETLLALLDAQRVLYGAQDLDAQLRQSRLRARVALYGALDWG